MADSSKHRFSGTARLAVLVAWLSVALGGCQALRVQDEPERGAADVIDEFVDAQGTQLQQDALAARAATLAEDRSQAQKAAITRAVKRQGDIKVQQIGGAGLGDAGPASEGTAGQGEDRTFVELDFDDVEMLDLIHAVFDQHLSASYTILDSFKSKKVNFRFRGDVTPGELTQVLEAFLAFHGVTVTFDSGIYAIGGGKQQGGRISDSMMGRRAQVLPLKYISAKDFLSLARRLVAQETEVHELNGMNSVLVVGKHSDVDSLDRLRANADIETYRGRYLITHRPAYLTPAALSSLLSNYRNSVGVPKSVAGELFEVSTLEEQDLVVVIARDKDAKQLVVEFLRNIDNAQSDQRRIFRYRLTNQNAGDLLGTLRNVLTAVDGKGSPVDVVADKATNSVIIVAPPEDYARMYELIRHLDDEPPAVQIDVTIAEVILNESMRYGVEWFLFEKLGGAKQAEAQLDLTNAVTQGLNLGVLNLNNNKFAALELIGADTDFNILSNPQILVKNGSQAKMIIGREVAIEKSTLTTDTSGSTSQTEFERRDVATVLEVQPTIGPGHQIQLAFSLTDERDSGTDTNGQPIFTKRVVTTDLVAYNGQTLMIAGIIRNTRNNSVDKIPGVGDIDFIGNLFRNNNTRSERVELVIFVTPRLVLDVASADILTRAVMEAFSTPKTDDQFETAAPGPGETKPAESAAQ